MALMEFVLANSVMTILVKFAMDVVAWSSYDTMYKDLDVIIIMTKNCRYNSLREWLAQHHIGPIVQAFPTSFNDLVEIMISKNVEPGPFKPKSKRAN